MQDLITNFHLKRHDNKVSEEAIISKRVVALKQDVIIFPRWEKSVLLRFSISLLSIIHWELRPCSPWTAGPSVRIGPVRSVVRIYGPRFYLVRILVRIFIWSGTWSGFWSGFFLVRYVVRNSVRKSAPGRIIRTGPDFGPDFKNNEKIKNFESVQIFKQY